MTRPMTMDWGADGEPRRGAAQADEAYLKLVGDRVRLERVRRGLSRKALSDASGVSERYLAELERGTGNASLLVVRNIATAMAIRVADLASEDADRSVDLSLAVESVEPGELEPAEGPRAAPDGAATRRSLAREARVALVGLRGAGKTSAGREVANALAAPFVELDREIEMASGLPLAELLASQGGAVFRRLERESLDRAIAAHERAVIAAGGGIVMEPETFDVLLANAFVVWLRASPEQHVNRAMKAGLLSPAARHRRVVDEVRLVLESRAPLYGLAHAEIDTTAKSVEDVAAAVLAAAAGKPRS